MPLSKRLPSLALLDLFLSTVEFNSLSRAAAVHGVSQPAVSAAMTKLERSIGVPLLQRTASGSRPTSAGLLVAEWARDLLEGANRFDGALEALRKEAASRLVIAASYTIAEYLLPAWLTRFRAEWPDVAIQLTVANSARVSARVLAGDVDLGFIEDRETQKGLESREVATDELVLVVPPDHPWTRRKGGLAAKELAAARLVMREKGSGTRDVLEHVLHPHACDEPPPPPLLELGSTTAVKAAVVDGAGPSAVSRLALVSEIRHARVRTVPVHGIDLHRSLRAAWRTGERLSRPALDLVAWAARPAAPERSASPGG